MPILLDSDLNRPLPEMIRVRQRFNSEHIEDSEVPAAVRAQFERGDIRSLIKPGMHIAVAVGSRGIRNLFPIVRERQTDRDETEGVMPLHVGRDLPKAGW